MRLTRVEIATAVLGQLHGPDGAVTHVSIDSRASSLDSLFVAIVGERDGHDFIDAARSAGATTWLTSRNDVRHGAIAVDDTQRALTMLASYARGKTTDRVIGVTGSTGKTSTKDLLAAILGCKGPATASDKSFNNELGVPLTLLNGPDHAWATVIEMGARRRGHVAALCEIARPSVGVITNIGSAHLGEFGSVGAIAEAKGELIEALPSTGVAVLNRDDAHFAALAARGRASVLAFGEHTTADVRANDVRLDRDLQPSFVLQSPWGAAQVVVAARGRHQVGNSLAAAAAALSVGADLNDVVTGLAAPTLSPWRMELHRLENGAMVINDSYNANPVSMRAALEALASLPAIRRVAVLGTMAELGGAAAAEHRGITEFAASRGIEVIAVNEKAYGAAVNTPDIDATVLALGPISDGVAVLVKGSRVAGLEMLAAQLVSGERR